jgi:hypothetical protein
LGRDDGPARNSFRRKITEREVGTSSIIRHFSGSNKAACLLTWWKKEKVNE